MALDLAAVLTESVNTAAASANPFNGFVFLCGGRVDWQRTSLPSARHFAWDRSQLAGNKLAGRQVIVAERVTELLQGGDFSDLLEFEEHLAALAACIVIFVESPGSIAELGSFSVMKHVAPKLLVICEQQFESGQPSFIFLGPITSLRRRDAKQIQIFPLAESGSDPHIVSAARLEDCWTDIEAAINDFSNRPVKDVGLDVTELSHRLLLIVELTRIFTALRQTELLACLDAFGSAIPQNEARRAIRLLTTFGLLAERSWSHERFMVSPADEPLIRFRRISPDPRPFDRLRFTQDRLTDYEKHDRRKYKAILAFRRECEAR